MTGQNIKPYHRKPLLLLAGFILALHTGQDMAFAQSGPASTASQPKHGSDDALRINESGTVQLSDRTGSVVRRLSMGIGKSVIIDLPRDASEIFVGSPKVANAVVRSSRRLYVIATDNGQTSIFAMDAEGRQIAVLEITVGREIDELRQILKAALPDSDIILRTINDTIIMTGSVESAGDAQKALDIARGFVSNANGPATAAVPAASGAGAPSQNDGRVINSLTIRGKDQVMIKVTIAEMSRKVIKQLGVDPNFSGSWGKFELTNPFTVNQTLVGSSTSLTGTSGNISATIKAYERYGVGRVLAEPTVTAVSGENAGMTVGGELPVSGGSTCTTSANGAQSCVPSITYKAYGVSLNFTPVVLSQGRILLHFNTEVTDIDDSRTNGSFVAFRTRKHSTSVELPSGGSIASAGLIQTTSSQVINGLPGLLNLPVLGTLFRSRDYQRSETELMVIVTPYIAKPVSPNELSRPTDGFTDTSDPQAVLLGSVNKIYASPGNPALKPDYRGKVGFIQD